MNLKKITVLSVVICGLVFSSGAKAEMQKVEFPAASPGCTLKQRIGLTDVEIVYSRPSVKGREVFGGLVPYGKVWRTGANQATKITFSTNVKLNGHEVPAGTYALMTIPDKDEWTVIINKGPEQWGAYKYDEKQDLVRFKVKPIKTDQLIETFTIEFNDLRDESGEIRLAWDKTVVPIKMDLEFAKKLQAQIEEVMASDSKEKPYFQAAQFYLNHGLDLQKAKKWADEAVAQRDAFFTNYVKAQILAKLGDKEGAIAASKHSTELAEKANDLGYVKLNADLMSHLK